MRIFTFEKIKNFLNFRIKNNRKEFIINTPTIEDTKVWAGNLGKGGTHAAVFAQLYTADGKCHGKIL